MTDMFVLDFALPGNAMRSQNIHGQHARQHAQQHRLNMRHSMHRSTATCSMFSWQLSVRQYAAAEDNRRLEATNAITMASINILDIVVNSHVQITNML